MGYLQIFHYICTTNRKIAIPLGYLKVFGYDDDEMDFKAENIGVGNAGSDVVCQCAERIVHYKAQNNDF
jgi:hypothetical protein